jgi:hypothetical protein
MSLLLRHSLSQAIDIMQGSLTIDSFPNRFPIEGMRLWNLSGLHLAFANPSLNLDRAMDSVIRGWWSQRVTWGVMVSGTETGISWNFVLAESDASSAGSLAAALPGAQLAPQSSFSESLAGMRNLTHRVVMAGHPGISEAAVLDTFLRTMSGRPFTWLVFAQAVGTPELIEGLSWLHQEQQYTQDEHLSRPGLEHGTHTEASRYVALLQAAEERIVAAQQEGGWLARCLLSAAYQDDLNLGMSILHSAYGTEGGNPEPLRWQPVESDRGLTFLRSSEITALVRLPKEELPGFVVESAVANASANGATSMFSSAPPNALSGPSICLGRIVDANQCPGSWLEIPTTDLCRHMLIAGMTGSGKTTTCEHILLELCRDHHIPWLVLEPGLNPSYRRLLRSEIGKYLRVYAPGSPEGVPLPLNPLAAPPGIGLAEHIGGLYSVLTSAFELVTPMPEVLAMAIEQTYRHHGWDPNGIVPATPPPPYEALLIQLDKTISTFGYTGEIAGNIRAGLALRLRSLATGPLGPGICSNERLDTKALTTFPTVIELAAIPNADTQALVMGLLALQLRHYWRLVGRSEDLRHVLVIEEAHRLLRNEPDTATHSPRSKAVEDIANLLAELRGMGAGLIISDQTPSALIPACLANTGIKILHRLDHPEDRDLAGNAANLPESSTNKHLATPARPKLSVQLDLSLSPLHLY